MKPVTITLPGFDPICFFQKLSSDENSPAYITSGTWIIIAWDPVETMCGKDLSVLKRAKNLQKKHHQKAQSLPFIGGSVGWISYDAGLRAKRIRSKHKQALRIPDVCFHRYTQALLADGKNIIAIGDARFRKHIQQIHARPLPSSNIHPPDFASTITSTQYTDDFCSVMKRIRDGDVYQLNYSYPFTACSSQDPRQLFCALLRHHPAPAAAYLEHGTSALLSLSPESFIEIQNGIIRTSPIKGTRPRGRTSGEDNAMKQELMSSEKETAELNMIVDLLRNDIGEVSETGSVRVRAHRKLQKNPSLWHTYSVIEAKLLPTLHPLDALLSMFPGGSVTGCPKTAAMEDIDTIEHSARGLYCGSVVMLSDDAQLHSSIIIRSIERSGIHMKLGVGGGIVSDSVCDDEKDETLQKAARILSLPGTRTWVNGREISDHSALVALDPASPKTHGVFETMMIQKGRLQHRAAHRRRIETSAEMIGLSVSAQRWKEIDVFLDRALDTAKKGIWRAKIVLTKKDILIELRPYTKDPARAHGVSVMTTKLVRSLPAAKALPYHQEWQALSDARSQGFDDALLLQPDGTIPEAAISNLFFVKKSVLCTAGSRMLPGITRARVLRLAKRLGVQVHFVMPTEAQLSAADEIFLTRSTDGIIPVLRIGMRTIGRGKVGRITRMLSATLFSR